MEQIRLMKYDRSKTIFEQTLPSDRLGKQGSFQPLKDLRKINLNVDKTKTINTNKAYNIYLGLKKEIDGWGTNDTKVLNYLNQITRTLYPQILNWVIQKEGFSSIIEWVMTDYSKVSERSADDGKPKNFWTQPGGVERYFNWYSNDKTVIAIGKILSKFSDLNSGEGDYKISYRGEVDLTSDSLRGTASNKQLTEIAHVVLPIASIAATLFTGGIGAILLGMAIELGDSAIYNFVDKDPYSAGLALIFAFAGPLDEVLSPLFKTYGKKIMVKLMKKQALNKNEKTVLAYINRNQYKLKKLTKLGILRKSLKNRLLKISNVNGFVRGLLWLVKKGFVAATFLTKMGLIVGGSFYTWGKIAEYLGIKELSEKKKETLKKDSIKINQNTDLCNLMKQNFQKINDKNIIFSEKNNIRFNEDVVLLQLFLKSYNKDSNFKWGYYDNNTKNSVIKLQQKNNLITDGLAGKETFGKILSLISSKKYCPIYYSGNIPQPDYDYERKINAKIDQTTKIPTKKEINEAFNKEMEKKKKELINEFEKSYKNSLQKSPEEIEKNIKEIMDYSFN